MVQQPCLLAVQATVGGIILVALVAAFLPPSTWPSTLTSVGGTQNQKFERRGGFLISNFFLGDTRNKERGEALQAVKERDQTRPIAGRHIPAIFRVRFLSRS